MSNQSNQSATSGQSATVLEMVLFRLQPGVSQEKLLQFSDEMQSWLEQQPGYLQHEIYMAEDGQWLDHVEWASMGEAMAASEQFFAQPFAANLGEIFAEGATSQHLYQVRNYAAMPV